MHQSCGIGACVERQSNEFYRQKFQIQVKLYDSVYSYMSRFWYVVLSACARENVKKAAHG